MNYYIVIPAYNEEKYIALTLQSILSQTVLPKKIVVVNDNSTDKTEEIVLKFHDENPMIRYVFSSSSAIHLPGSKVVAAFNKGVKTLNSDYDFIVKLDADLILPENYFETIIEHFKSDSKIGMAGGFAYIEKNGDWILENLTDKDHIRGAFKAYRKECFEQIGGLKEAMGWDTVDELVSRFYGWKIKTDKNLKIKHLKPTGAKYSESARYVQGEAFYAMGYGWYITAIASAKLAWKKRNPKLYFDYIKGYEEAFYDIKPMLVTPEQARFVKKYRVKNMFKKIFRL